MSKEKEMKPKLKKKSSSSPRAKSLSSKKDSSHLLAQQDLPLRTFQLLLLLLVLNLFFWGFLLIKISALQDRITLQNGGKQNLQKLKEIYTTDEYSEYLKWEITTLELRLKALKSE